MPLKTDYTNDILNTDINVERKYVIKDNNGSVVVDNATIEDVTAYTREGSRFGANDINATNTAVNELNNSLSDISTYSTEETVIGTYEGKPLYRKLFKFKGILSNLTLYHNIPDVEMIYIASGSYYIDSGSIYIPLPYINTSNITWSISPYVTPSYINISTGLNRANAPAVLVLEYTKTTD